MKPIFSNCNVCGRQLVRDDELSVGMCAICANEEEPQTPTPMRKKLTDYWYNYRIAAPDHRTPQCHQTFMMGALLVLRQLRNCEEPHRSEELAALCDEAEEYARLSNHPLARKQYADRTSEYDTP